MRILHLLSQHPESTGSGFYLQNIIRQAAAAGHDNYLVAGVSPGLTPHIDSLADSAFSPIVFESGVLDFTIPGMSDVMPYPSTRFSTLSMNQLDRYNEESARVVLEAARIFSPDIIHSHHLWLASSSARHALPEIPMVTSCHSTDLRQFVQCAHLRTRVLEPCRRIERILALSTDQKRRVTDIYGIPPEKIDVVGGGFDPSLFSCDSKLEPDPVRVLYAGKLSYAKGVDCLLRAFAGLHDHNIQLHLAGSGTGEEGQDCLQLAESLKGRAVIHGRVDQQRLAELMAESHIFVLPSFYEGLPLVLLEALASGCRILTTDLPGSKELLSTADSDLVKFIPLPELESVDRPGPAGLQQFEGKLTRALTTLAGMVRDEPGVDQSRWHHLVADHDWVAVFDRVEKAYRRVIRR